MTLLVLTLIATFLGTLLAVEAKAWMPYLAARLVRATIARFPGGLDEETASRWREEIEADLASYEDRPFGSLLFALRLRRRGGKALAAELALEQELDASKPTTDRGPRVIIDRGHILVKTDQGTFEVRLDTNVGAAYRSYGTIVAGPERSVSITALGLELTKVIARAADIEMIRALGDGEPKRSRWPRRG
jgi:hypothetical protein